MRCWHKDLIPVLPRQQLLGQWRECCLIAKNIAEKGTPNHLLVNKVMKYPIEHFYRYAFNVFEEMERRNYKVDEAKFSKWFNAIWYKNVIIKNDELFMRWHNDRYLAQCYYNLQEKYDCGGISEEEWQKIEDFYRKRSALVECNMYNKETIYPDCTVQIWENTATGKINHSNRQGT